MRYARSELLVALILLLNVFSGCGKDRSAEAEDHPAAPEVAVVKARLRNVSDTLEIASEFQPYQEIDVYAKVSGYIQKLDINWGTHVRQGQLLAVLEIPELNSSFSSMRPASVAANRM